MSNIRHQNTFLFEAKRWSYTRIFLKHKVEAYLNNNELRKPAEINRTNLFFNREWSAPPIRFWVCLACSSWRRAQVPWLVIKFVILQLARLAHIWDHDSKESILPCHLVFPGEGKEFSSILKKKPCSSASILVITGSINVGISGNICYKERQKKSMKQWILRTIRWNWLSLLLTILSRNVEQIVNNVKKWYKIIFTDEKC